MLLFRRFVCLLIGLCLMGFGVAFGTRPGLGTTAISSAPYVINQICPLTFGTWTVIFNLSFMLLQMLILGKRYRWIQLLQLPAVAVFGMFIDLGMYVTSFWTPQFYILRVAETFLGAAVMAAGITALLLAELVYVPGDGLVRVIAEVYRFNFGKVKIFFDCSLVLLAIVLSLVFCHHLEGVREGTVLAALSVGALVRLYQHQAQKIAQHFLVAR